jgi:uncharacterized membrane protein YGL010W
MRGVRLPAVTIIGRELRSEEAAMKHVDVLLADYASYHRTRGNFVCHVFGVTLIMYGILAMLLLVPIGPGGITAAEVLLAAVFLYYLTLDVPLAFAVVTVAGLLDALARAVNDWRIGVAAFVVGWIFQAIGHARFERNRPAFFRNLVHLLVGPLYLVNELLRIRRPAAAGSSAK